MDRELASNRIDRIVEKVETIIDIRPRGFHAHVYLQRGDLKYKEVSFYQYNRNTIYLTVDKVSEGVFAHEITHVIVNYHYTIKLSPRTQEIITQYVDRYLWGDNEK